MIYNTKSAYFLGRKIKDKKERNELYLINITMSFAENNEEDNLSFLQILNNIMKTKSRRTQALDIIDFLTDKFLLPKKPLKIQMLDKIEKNWRKTIMNQTTYFYFDEKIGYNRVNIFSFIFTM